MWWTTKSELSVQGTLEKYKHDQLKEDRKLISPMLQNIIDSMQSVITITKKMCVAAEEVEPELEKVRKEKVAAEEKGNTPVAELWTKMQKEVAAANDKIEQLNIPIEKYQSLIRNIPGIESMSVQLGHMKRLQQVFDGQNVEKPNKIWGETVGRDLKFYMDGCSEYIAALQKQLITSKHDYIDPQDYADLQKAMVDIKENIGSICRNGNTATVKKVATGKCSPL